MNNPTALALLGYIAWFLLLLAIMASHRTYMSLVRGKAANSFRPDGSDVSDFSVRLSRVHANCYEGFPFFGGLLLLSLATGAGAITDALALLMLGARLAQSLVHLASTSVLAVQARFAMFLVQFVIAAYWVAGFYGKFAA